MVNALLFQVRLLLLGVMMIRTCKLVSPLMLPLNTPHCFICIEN
jgi:hypothetical protein